MQKYLYLIGIGIILSGCLYAIHTVKVESAVNQAISDTTLALNREYQSKLDKAKEDAQKVTDDLLEGAQKDREIKDAKIKDINGRLSVALNELRDRPKRPAPQDPTAPPEDRKACTGADLYGEDAEFLTREAARADTIVEERDFYYRRYEQARDALQSLRNSP